MGYLEHLALILAVRETSYPGGQHRALLGKLALALTRKMEHGRSRSPALPTDEGQFLMHASAW